MPEPDFTIKRGDTASRIDATMENSGGTPVSIENATVLLKLASISGGTLVIAGTAVIDQVGNGGGTAGAMGQLHFNWATADTATLAGLYVGEWEVTFASGARQTFPNTDPFLVNITPDLPV